MSQFIGNDKVCFNVNQITCIYWGGGKTTIEFTNGEPLELLHRRDDDDFDLINNLRETLGFERFSRIID
jgi:hypothetical protein